MKKEEKNIIVGYLTFLLLAKDKKEKGMKYEMVEAIILLVVYCFLEWCFVGAIVLEYATDATPYVVGFLLALILDQILEVLTLRKKEKQRLTKKKAH